MKLLNLKYLTLSVFFSILFLSSFSQKSEITKIKGKINNNTFPYVFLLEYGQKIIKIDSVPISKTGDFLIKTAIKETAVYQLKFNDTIALMFILSPGQSLSITSDTKDLIANLKIKGSPDSKLIYDTQKQIQVFINKVDSLNNIYKENKNKPNINEIVAGLQNELNKILLAQSTFINTTILNNLHSLASLFFIDKLDFNKDFETYRKLDSTLYIDYPNNVFVIEIHNKVSKVIKLSIGQVAPDINLPDTSGKLTALSSLKGKIVLIDFWASWCGPCKKEIPNMKKIYKKYKNNGFEIYGVSLDKIESSWINSIVKDSLNWIHVSDLKYWQSEGAALYDVTSIPFTVLIDKEGKIIAKGLRGNDLEAKLEEIFKQ
jgi:thiol-disulfide isomerase/thioredoxin